ncbi:MAG TPA: hypothetical protein VGD74_03405 [Vulgatibacter sp.]
MARGLAPILGAGGILALEAEDGQTSGHRLSWEEFAGLFTVESMALAYDGTTAPGGWSIRRGLARRPASRAAGFR